MTKSVFERTRNATSPATVGELKSRRLSVSSPVVNEKMSLLADASAQPPRRVMLPSGTPSRKPRPAATCALPIEGSTARPSAATEAIRRTGRIEITAGGIRTNISPCEGPSYASHGHASACNCMLKCIQSFRNRELHTRCDAMVGARPCTNEALAVWRGVTRSWSMMPKPLAGVWRRRLSLALPLALGHATSHVDRGRAADCVFVAMVADGATYGPIIDADVVMTDLSRSVKTNWIGEGVFAAVPPVRHHVRVRKLGYAHD